MTGYLGDPAEFVDRVVKSIHSASAAGDRIESGQRHDRMRLTNGAEQEDFSPSARLHPDMFPVLDEVRQQARVRPDSRWLEEHNFTYQRSNAPGRSPVRANYGCVDPDCDCGDDGGHDLAVVVPFGDGNPIAQFRSGTDVSVEDPFGVREVHLHDPMMPTFTPKLPWKWTDEGVVTPSLVALPVMYQYSTERVARSAMEQFASRCFWQGRRTKVRHPKHPELNCAGRPDSGLMVSAGTVTHVFPTCDTCRWELGKDVTPGGWERGYVEDDGRLDYVVNDGWDRCANYPPDEDR